MAARNLERRTECALRSRVQAQVCDLSSYCYQRPQGHTGCENPRNPLNTLPRQPLPLFYHFCLTISPALSVTLKRSCPDPEEEVWVVMAQGLHVLVTQEARNPSAVPHLSVFYATVRKLGFESSGTRVCCEFVLVLMCVVPADTQLEMSTRRGRHSARLAYSRKQPS